MAEREDIEKASSEPAASPDGAPKPTETPTEMKSELPAVESPSISPTGAPEVVVEPRLDTAIPFASDSPIAPTPASRFRFALRPRHKRYAILAAAMAIAAAYGGVIGAVASGGFAKPAAVKADAAAVEERKAMQQSIAHLTKEITTLKVSIDAANKTAHTQIAKIGDKLNDKITDKLNDKINEKISERLTRERTEVTGSISAPQTAAPTAAPAPAPAPQLAAPIPTPRPPQRTAAVESPPPQTPAARPPLVPGWSVRVARDGYALLEGHGDIYQVVPGVPVPGLGMIQQIRREDGRWVVVTPRGMVVSMRDRRYFESF
jgi:hypothetical protein